MARIYQPPQPIDTSGMQNQGPTSGGNNKLKEALFKMSLMDPKNQSTYKSYMEMYDKAYPEVKVPKLTGKPASDVNLSKNVIRSAQTASSKYKPEYSGIGDSIIGKAQVALNLSGSEDRASYDQYIADLRTSVRNYISGAAIPESEAKELNRLLPNPWDSDTRTKEKLKGLQIQFMGKIGSALSTAGIEQTPEEYMKQGRQNPNLVSPSDAPQEGGVLPFLKELFVNPLIRTGKNIVDAGVLSGQAAVANTVGAFNPQMGAKIANYDPLGSQARVNAETATNEDKMNLVLRQLVDSASIYGGAKSLQGAGKVLGGIKSKFTGGTPSNILSPVKSTGKALEEVRAATNLANDETQSALTEAVKASRGYKGAGPKLQKELDAVLKKMYDLSSTPADEVTKTGGTLNLNEMMKYAGKDLEMSDRAREILWGGQKGSGVLKEALNQYQTLEAKQLASKFSKLKPFQNVPKNGLRKGLEWLIAGGITGTGILGYQKWFGKK